MKLILVCSIGVLVQFGSALEFRTDQFNGLGFQAPLELRRFNETGGWSLPGDKPLRISYCFGTESDPVAQNAELLEKLKRSGFGYYPHPAVGPFPNTQGFTGVKVESSLAETGLHETFFIERRLGRIIPTTVFLLISDENWWVVRVQFFNGLADNRKLSVEILEGMRNSLSAALQMKK